ncbi:MAG: hypothetical protein WA324_10970 [Bryobacteraceae bacterium]
MKRRIESALPYLQHIVRYLPDALCDGPSMHRLEGNRLQDQQVKRALYQVGWFAQSLTSVTDNSVRRQLSARKY